MDRKCNIPKKNCTVRRDGYCMLDVRCKPIIDKCVGCAKIENNYCQMYINPSIKWRLGVCPGATHVKKKVTDKQRKRVGQQKQRKFKR